MSNQLQITDTDGSRVVRFIRPEIRNPLSTAVLNQLEEILKTCAGDDAVKHLIFTGSGDVFASGADLREIASLTPASAAAFAQKGQRLMERIASLPQMTVAAVNGYCFGGALDLALACRRRIAGPEALFCHPGAGLGIMTGWGGTQRLPRLVGATMALEIFFTGRRIGADEALRIGLIDAIVDDPLTEALARAA